MTLVVDASVIIKWLLQDSGRESATGQATELMRSVVSGELTVLQPFHWLAEVAAVASRLSPATAERDVLRVQALELPETDDPAVLARACRIATRSRLHAFDTLYHAVALETPGAVLVTADDAYLRAARSLGGIVPLADWQNAAS
ncbi:MAG: type II toxin-antitoxin system VapC family toxin [Gammaproteobacteria bacterium]